MENVVKNEVRDGSFFTKKMFSKSIINILVKRITFPFCEGIGLKHIQIF